MVRLDDHRVTLAEQSPEWRRRSADVVRKTDFRVVASIFNHDGDGFRRIVRNGTGRNSVWTNVKRLVCTDPVCDDAVWTGTECREGATRRVYRTADLLGESERAARMISMFVREDHAHDIAQVHIDGFGPFGEGTNRKTRVQQQHTPTHFECDGVTATPGAQDCDSHPLVA